MKALVLFVVVLLALMVLAVMALRRRGQRQWSEPPRAPLVRAALEAGLERMQKTARRNRYATANIGWWPELAALTNDERDAIRKALMEAARLPNEALDSLVARAAARAA